MFGVPYEVIGRYGGASLKDKLKFEMEREREFLRMFEDEPPDVVWSKGSVSAFRVAFGLRIPIVCNNDTPHNEPVVRLTVPLVDRLLIPEPFEKREWARFGIDLRRITKYKGLEEVAWMKEVRADRRNALVNVSGGSIDQADRLIVIRGVEYKSSYYHGGMDISSLLPELAEIATVVYIPRYEEDIRVATKVKGVIIPRRVPYAPELLASADLVISSGGTMGTEAALAGTPTVIYHFWTPLARYLQRKGFPVWKRTSPSGVLRLSSKILRDPDRYRKDTREKLKRMESPIPKLVDLIKAVVDEGFRRSERR